MQSAAGVIVGGARNIQAERRLLVAAVGLEGLQVSN
jgi:hypothetical protein